MTASSSSSPLSQQIPAFRKVIKDHGNLGTWLLSFAAFLADLPLVVKQLAQHLLVQILEDQRLLVLITHFLQILSERSILGVELYTGRKEPNSLKHVLIIP